MSGYNFAAARQRQQSLIGMYRQQKRAGAMNPELEIEFMALIDEIDIEIAEVHKSGNGKISAVGSNGYSVIHIGNVCTPIVPSWAEGVKRGVLS